MRGHKKLKPGDEVFVTRKDKIVRLHPAPPSLGGTCLFEELLAAKPMRAFSLVVFLVMAGCRREEKLSFQSQQAQAQVARWVPSGTPQSEAQRIMQQHHFIAFQTNADSILFAYRVPDNPFVPMVYQVWMVTLALDHKKVSGVDVMTSLKGL